MTNDSTALTTISPVTDLKDFNEDRDKLKVFLKKQLKEGTDFGIIPYTNNKRVLYQPGAEKLAKYFGLRPEYQCLKEIEDWEHGFVYYKYKCILYHIKSGLIVGDAERSCNSKEKKHATKSVYDAANTCKAMAQKRAIVAAVRTATMATDLFEDAEGEPEEAGPSTRDENPARQRLMMRLFATAADRGFDGEKLKQILKIKFKVESTNDLTNEQMVQSIEALEMNYKAVGRGNKPEKLAKAVVEAEVVNSEEEKFIDDAMSEVQKQVEEPIRDVKNELKAKIERMRSRGHQPA